MSESKNVRKSIKIGCISRKVRARVQKHKGKVKWSSIMVKFYFVRHGETDWNLQGRFQGIENIPLNETGLQQAENCGKGFKQCGISFDYIVSSPLDRARVTAERIAEYVGINVADVQIDNRLIERDFGEISGRKREDRERMFNDGRDYGMEPLENVIERMQQVMEYYSDINSVSSSIGDTKNVVMVTHGASIRALLAKYCEAGSAPTIEVQKNTYVTVIAYDGEKYYMEAYDVAPEDL